MIHLLETKKENLIAVKLEDKISKSDVEKLHPLIHSIAEKGNKVDFYLEMNDFHGYDLQGFWADMKVDASHISDYGKMAFVGKKKWQKWVAKTTNIFTDSEVKYFNLTDKDNALEWISQ
jgi:stage II sporulation SpoAA-like protein|tara:strand:- start:3606 stop:3962 length:357 start_codon:yes stop_codon:yes gene_type:complete